MVNLISDNKIDCLWILEPNSGICIFEENYEDITTEGTSIEVIAGFLSAILSFADEAFAETIQHIKFSNKKIFFELTDYALFVVAIKDERKINSNNTYELIKEISNQFYSQFREALEHWNGNINQFDSFSESLKLITKRKPTQIKILQKYDIREAFKKTIRKRINYYKKQKRKFEEVVKGYVENFNQKIRNKLALKQKENEKI